MKIKRTSVCPDCKKQVYLGGPVTKGCNTCLVMYRALQKKRAKNV